MVLLTFIQPLKNNELQKLKRDAGLAMQQM